MVMSVSFVVIFFMSRNTHHPEPDTLHVLFPFSTLKKDKTLLAPKNTRSTSEYYLLENLGLGLVRDDINDPRGYEGGLAESWQQIDPTVWVFKLKKNLKWSDNSPIYGHQIVKHFYKLKDGEYRHVRYLKFLKNVRYDENESTITLRFTVPVNQDILYELSLADTVLTSENNLNMDWHVTSGPYFVEEYDFANLRLYLTANQNCTIVTKDAPQKVVLFSLKNLNELPLVFKDIPTDIFYSPVPSFDPIFDTLFENAPNIFRGQYTFIHYFKFNPQHGLFFDEQARKEFAFLVHEAFKNTDTEKFRHEYQMIPLGFKGRVPNFKFPTLEIVKLKNRNLKVYLNDSFLRFRDGEFLDKLKHTFKNFGVPIEFEFEETKDFRFNTDKEVFANAHIFQGNQNNPLSSWNFLFSSSNESLKPFYNSVQKYLNDILKENSDSNNNLLEQFHYKILESAYLVPFLVEPAQVFFSDRVNLSNWNEFDTRMRLYLVRWN